jgi:hypothetical protein
MISVSSDDTDWTAINSPVVTPPDDPNDHQTGTSEGDIVGNNTGASAALTNFDGNGSPGILDDGYIGFRIRVGKDNLPPGFASFFGVGMDANTDGVIDLFLAVDDKSSGAGANTPPNTTAIISTLLVAYAENDPIYDNYDFSSATTIDPGETNTDLEWGRESGLLRYLRNSARRHRRPTGHHRDRVR